MIIGVGRDEFRALQAGVPGSIPVTSTNFFTYCKCSYARSARLCIIPLQRLVLQKKSVHVNATVKEENWQELKFLAPVDLIWSNPRFSSASIGEKNDRS
jgi:hypothetical protein